MGSCCDSFLNIQQLKLIEKHSPDTRVEIKNALIGDYGTDTRVSNTTGDELIYVAIQRDPNDLNDGLIR